MPFEKHFKRHTALNFATLKYPYFRIAYTFNARFLMRFRSFAPNLSARSLFRTPCPVGLFMCSDAFSLQFGLVSIRCKVEICPAFRLVPLVILLYAVDYSKKPLYPGRDLGVLLVRMWFACLPPHERLCNKYNLFFMRCQVFLTNFFF